MQDMHRISELGHIDYPELSVVLPDPDLVDALADIHHRFPVCGLKAMLHPVKLKTGVPPGFLREILEVLQRCAMEDDVFHVSLYKIMHKIETKIMRNFI